MIWTLDEKRMNIEPWKYAQEVKDRAEAAEARVAALEAEVAELHKARDLAGVIVDDGNTLCDWIVGAQNEIKNLAVQLRDIWDMHDGWSTETPLGQTLDGMGDEADP